MPKSPTDVEHVSKPVVAPNHTGAIEILADWLEQQVPNETISAIGHRVVHGGPKYSEPCVINDEVLTGLRELIPLDPEHLPIEISLIEALQKLFPHVQQMACFDTAFHHSLPSVARLLAIPRRYEKEGLRRYGFHGLSYTYLMSELERLDGLGAADGRVILAHLGSGVSLAAVQHGKSIDTTMGLTPASGVPMSTRSGDIDPGLASYLAHSEGLSADGFSKLLGSQSGLLGISGTTSDMEQLLKHEADDDRAKDAIDLFCYQVKKSIGSLAAAMGGLETLVFAGGMGENAPKIRARICAGLEFLGINVDSTYNDIGSDVISVPSGPVVVRIIHTDESSVIAHEVSRLITERPQS